MKSQAARRRGEQMKGMVLGHCRRTGKRRWATRDEARAHVRSLRAHGDKGPRLATFRCRRGCGDWHVGHRVKGATDAT